MKNLITITFFLAINMVFSQTKLEFTVVNNCSEKKVDEYDITILSLDFDKKMLDYLIQQDSILNIEKGIYSISVSIEEGDYFKSYNFVREFKADSIYSINLEMPRITKKYTRELHYPTDLGFYYCEKICDGWQKDYYANGKIRMEGEFKNGIPIKEIKKYNESGELVEIELYRRNGTYKKSKYPDYANYLKNN